jgi:hypothetical protein
MFPIFWVGSRGNDFDEDLIGTVLWDGDVLERGGEVGIVVDEEVLHFKYSVIGNLVLWIEFDRKMKKYLAPWLATLWIHINRKGYMTYPLVQLTEMIALLDVIVSVHTSFSLVFVLD